MTIRGKMCYNNNIRNTIIIEVSIMREKRIIIEGQETPYLIRDDGTVWSEKRNRILKGTIERNEYHTVYLTINQRQYNLMIHRLVAEAFCDNPNGYTVVHHKDNNKLNNRAENLEWVSTLENNQTENRKLAKVRTLSSQINMQEDWKTLAFCSDYAVNRNGQMANLKTGKLILGSDRNGYKRFAYNNHIYSIHRLVYEAFNGPIPEHMYIDHIDGNRANNALDNLRLVTQSDNMMTAMKNGHSGQIAVLQFDKQGNFIQEFPTIQAAANAVGVTHPAIRSALTRGGTSGGFLWKRKSQ